MLQQSWPLFLDLLDENPQKAFSEFYSFARKLLTVKPPRTLQELSKPESEDMIQDIILHCVQDSFRVLRRYQDRGKPFAAWLYILAHNKCLDYLRGLKREVETTSGGFEPGSKDHATLCSDPDIDPEVRTRLHSVIELVGTCVSKLGDYCELLLKCAADEYTPSEIVLVLGWPKDKNKKVSDDLRECRKRLRKMLEAQGVDLTNVPYAQTQS
jgi:RNA polymerase sigma factor (sigma-70 family)